MKKTTDGVRGDKAKLGEAARGEGRIALSDEEKRRQTSKHDVGAGSPDRSERSAGTTGDDELTSTSRQQDISDKGLEDFQQEELSGTSDDMLESVNYSDTDEDEDEGLGDGNLGRTVREGLE
jgi:hypothetical protein